MNSSTVNGYSRPYSWSTDWLIQHLIELGSKLLQSTDRLSHLHSQDKMLNKAVERAATLDCLNQQEIKQQVCE